MDLKPIPNPVIGIIVATILFCGLNLQQVGALDDEKSEYEKKRAKLEKMRAEKKGEYEKMRAEKIAKYLKMKNTGLEKRSEKIAEFERNMAAIENAELVQKRAQFEKQMAEKSAAKLQIIQKNAELKAKNDELKKKRAEQIAEFERNMAELEREEKAKLEQIKAEKKAQAEKESQETSAIEPIPETTSDKANEDTDVKVEVEDIEKEEANAQNEKRIALENAREQLKATYAKLVSEGTKERGEYQRTIGENLYYETMAEKQRLESSTSTNLPDNMWGPLVVNRYQDPEDHHPDYDIYMINGESLVGERLNMHKIFVFIGKLASNDSVAINCKIVDSKGTIVYETNYPPYMGEFTDTSYFFMVSCGDYTPTKPDTYTIISTFDSKNTLQESDESNNVSIDTLAVY